MQNLTHIAEQLQQLKRSYGVTYRDIAYATGLSCHACNEIHHGRATVETLTRVAAFYGFALNITGADLRDERLAQRRSAGEVARRANVCDLTVNRVESGNDQVRVSTICKIADALGVRLALERRVTQDEARAWESHRVVPPGLLNLDEVISEVIAESRHD